MSDKCTFLIITSEHNLAGNMPIENLLKQIEVIESMGVAVDLLVDPDIVAIEESLIKRKYDCAYTTTMYCYRKEDSSIKKQNFNVYKILEQYNQRFIGSDLFTQLLVNDKTICSNRSGIGLSGLLVTKSSLRFFKELLKKLKDYPYILKPNSLSCSLGITKDSIVNNATDLEIKVYNLFNKMPSINEIRIEKYLSDFREFTVAVLGNSGGKCYSITELDFDKDEIKVYSEDQKNKPLTERKVKYKLVSETEIYNELVFHAERLFDWFNMKDNARFDFLYKDRAYLIDVNAIPVTGNSFTWEWQKTLSFKKENGLSLILGAFYYRSLSSGFPIPLPQKIIQLIPEELTQRLKSPNPIDNVPESSPPTEQCKKTASFTMVDRIGVESEVLLFLKALVVITKPTLILETGTYTGSSSVAMAQGLKTNGFGKLITLEKDYKLYEDAARKLKGWPVEVVNISSLNFNLNESNIDLLFLDSHRPIRKQEFYRFLPKLSSNSLIIWHDSSLSQQVVYDQITELYNKKIIDRIDLPTPRGLTICKLKQN